jgi:hypothetical protein
MNALVSSPCSVCLSCDCLCSPVSSMVDVTDNITIRIDEISDDRLEYFDDTNLPFPAYHFPVKKITYKVLGGDIVISEDCFVPYVEGDEECCVNGDGCCFNDDFVGEKLMFKGLCPCNLRECKTCFLSRNKSIMNSKSFAMCKCLSNNHKGDKYVKTIKQPIIKNIEEVTPITDKQIEQYKKEKKLMGFLTDHYEMWEMNVKGKPYNELARCWKVYKMVTDYIEKTFLDDYGFSDADISSGEVKKHYYFCDDDFDMPIKWFMGGYDWNDANKPNWCLNDATFYFCYRHKSSKTYGKSRVAFDYVDVIQDTIECGLADYPKEYGNEYCFNLLEHRFQLALGNSCDAPDFMNLFDNESMEDLIREMVDSSKIPQVAIEIIDNGDCDIAEVMGCEYVRNEKISEYDNGIDNCEYYVMVYDEYRVI